MATTYRNYVTGSVQNLLTTELNSLANNSTAVSTSEYNNTSNRWMEGEVEVYVAASGANTGYVDLYLVEGTTTGNLATYSQRQNARRIGSIQLNGTTAVRKRFFVDRLAPYTKAVIANISGGSLASSGNTVTLLGINYTDS